MAKRKPSRRSKATPRRKARARTRKAAASAGAGPKQHPRLDQTLRSENASFPDNFHAMYDRGFREARGMVPTTAKPAISSGHKKLSKAVKDLDVHYDQTTQVPKMIITRRPKSILAKRVTGTPETAVTSFIQQRGDLWNLTADDARTIEVVSVSQPRGTATEPARGKRKSAIGGGFSIANLKTVNLIQRVEGREVFNSETKAAVNANNEVLSIAGQFFSGAASSATRSKARAHTGAIGTNLASPEVAIARAAFDLTNIAYTANDFERAIDPPGSGAYRFYAYKANDRRPPFERPVRVKDVMFPLGQGEFVPGFYVEIWIKGYPAFSYVMDAVGEPDVLYRKNLTSHAFFKYRVHNTGGPLFRPHDGPAPGSPHPTGVPDGFQASTVTEKLVKIESLLSGDPWLPAGATTTDGNNCIAYADVTPPTGFNAGDVLGQVTSPGTFGKKYDHSKPASDPNNVQNSVVGMFFHVNWLHDRWYEAGFDEASGNAQKNNFGRGGSGGDPILAEGNDFSGTDNANMATPADGMSPRMQMFIFTGTTPTRTSNHEALITFHEMGHYITNRLVGNGNGLNNQQGGAMGEGWGDFFAICMTSQKKDNFAKGVFAVGGWTDLAPGFTDNYYFSIRRYPYSADMTKSPLTFKHISNGVVLPTGIPINANSGGNNAVHNAGEVWCVMLWEVFIRLVKKHGHADAEKRMLAYVIGGLKNTPNQPTFVDARDGILTAVSAMDPGDLTTVKEGFAKRGIGTGAVAPPSNSSSLAGVVESFNP